jgi:hypothetical protein
VFTTANWNVAQTVTVTGVDDRLRDGNVNYSVRLTSAQTNQGPYGGIDPDDVQVTNQDDDKGSRRRRGGNRGPAVEEFSELAVSHLLSEFGDADGHGRVVDFDSLVRGRERAAARLDAAVDRFHAQDQSTAGQHDAEFGEELTSVLRRHS